MGYIEGLGPKLNYLVPGAVYGLNEPFNTYESIIWNDPRPLPSEAEILAVTQEMLDQATQNAEIIALEGLMLDSKIQLLLFNINFDTENRIRALEGKAIITKAQYKNAILSLYRTL